MSALKDFAQRILKQNPKNLTGVVHYSLSFETGEQGALKIYFPFAVKITKIRGIVIKALAATDAGTVTGANASGNSATGVLTFALSAAQGNEQSATPTTNNAVAAGSYYSLTPAKTTAGGKVQGSIEYSCT